MRHEDINLMVEEMDVLTEFIFEKNDQNFIKVIGVGGAGCNTVNHMIKTNIKKVDFIVCNTDNQVLERSLCETKILIGTDGRGAGGIMTAGEKAALDDIEKLKFLTNIKNGMVFLTAGMGGGTGTGVISVVAKLINPEILRVAIVTMPFHWEGETRHNQAVKGINNLKDHVDVMIIIENNKLLDYFANLTVAEAFLETDKILANSIDAIVQIIEKHFLWNSDFRNVQTVMKSGHVAMIGVGTASGADRAEKVVVSALNSPLLRNNSIENAKNVLMHVISGKDGCKVYEMDRISNKLKETTKGKYKTFMPSYGEDESLEDKIRVIIIATDFTIKEVEEETNTTKVTLDIVDEKTNTNKVTLEDSDEIKRKNAIKNAKQTTLFEIEDLREKEPIMQKPVSQNNEFENSGFEATTNPELINNSQPVKKIDLPDNDESKSKSEKENNPVTENTIIPEKKEGKIQKDSDSNKGKISDAIPKLIMKDKPPSIVSELVTKIIDFKNSLFVENENTNTEE